MVTREGIIQILVHDTSHEILVIKTSDKNNIGTLVIHPICVHREKMCSFDCKSLHYFEMVPLCGPFTNIML